MQLSADNIKEFQKIYKDRYGKDLPWEEASDAAHNLARLVEIMYDGWILDQRRKKRLEESPKGFHLEGVGYTCAICKDSVSDEQTWYDKWGIKCLTCQQAIDKKIIPGSAAKNDESWYSAYDLKSRFCINRHALRRFIKGGVLKPRIVPNENGTPHAYLFFVKDHKDTLPPKKLTESRLVKEVKDGKEWLHSEPWYKFVDPHEALRGYKIMNYLRVTNEKQDTSETLVASPK